LYRVHLTEEQRQEALCRSRALGVAPRTRERLEMVRLSDLGWRIPQIARHLGRTQACVRYWIKRYLAAGSDALPDQPHRGQASALTPAILTAIREELGKGERTWTARQIADWVAEQHGVRLCPEHLARLLKRVKLAYKRTQRSLHHKQDPDVVADRAADLKTLEKGAMPVGWTSAM
jgi:transposase